MLKRLYFQCLRNARRADASRSADRWSATACEKSLKTRLDVH
jgi:hypothetical protein